MNSKIPTFSVIIPTLNEEDHIGLLLDNIASQSIQAKKIFVVDANSSDKTCQIVRNHTKATCVEAHPPVGLQRKIGGEKATSEYLFFLDADVTLPDHFFDQSLQQMKARNLEVACPQYHPYQSTLPIRFVYGVFNLVFKITESWLASGAGSCIIVKKSVYDAIGGFDPSQTYDDIEFIRRASKRYRFGTLKQHIYVSDRRFRKYGVFFVTTQYLILSLFFFLGLFKLANIIPYTFGNYKKIRSSSNA